MTRGQLPKAYLRMDPDIDAKHPDNLAEFVRIMCAANRQPWRGRFRSRAVVEALVGKAPTKRAIERGDLIPASQHSCRQCPPGDGPDALYLDGWDTWQEGDLTVAERMRGYRASRNAKRNGTVTPTVTPSVTDHHANRNGPSRQQDNKTTSDDDPPNPPDEIELLTDDLLAPSTATPKQLRAMQSFARAVGRSRTVEVLQHWRGQLDVDDRFSGAYEQLQAETAKPRNGKAAEFAYLDTES